MKDQPRDKDGATPHHPMCIHDNITISYHEQQRSLLERQVNCIMGVMDRIFPGSGSIRLRVLQSAQMSIAVLTLAASFLTLIIPSNTKKSVDLIHTTR